MSRSSSSRWWFPRQLLLGYHLRGISGARRNAQSQNSAGAKPKLQQGVIKVSDISDAEGEESHICIGCDDDDRLAGGGGPNGCISALLAAGDGDAGCEPDCYEDHDDRPAGGGGPIGRTSELLGAGGDDAGCD